MTKIRIIGSALALLATVVATGCKTTPAEEPRVVVKEVVVTKPVPCPALGTLGPEPNYPDTEQALVNAVSVGVLARLYRIGRAMRQQRLTEYMAARAACEALEE